MIKEFDVDMNKKQEERIKFLENKYAPHKLSNGEKVSKEYESKINRKRYRLRRYFEVKNIAHEYKFNVDSLTKAMFLIEKIDDIQSLHRKATLKQIIASILLFCKYENKLIARVDESKIWKDYNLNWKLYCIVIMNMLIYYRQQNNVPYGCVVQDLIMEE